MTSSSFPKPGDPPRPEQAGESATPQPAAGAPATERRTTSTQRLARESQAFPRVERRRRAIGWRSQDVLRTASLIIGLYLLLQLLWVANELVMVGFLGVLFGLAVEAGVDQLQKFRIPRYVAAAGIVFAAYGVLIGTGVVLAPTLQEQTRELRVRLPQAADQFENWLRERQSGLLGLVLPSPSEPVSIGAAADSAAAPTEQVTQETVSLRERMGFGLNRVSEYLFPFLSSTLAVFAGIALITFLAIYIGADPDTYHAGLMHLFPHHVRRRAGEVLTSTATVLRRWLVTQLIAMVVIGVVTTIVLLVLDVKAAFALGLIAGLFEFIPTIGPILSAVPAIAMGFVDSPEKALWVALAYMGIQFVENNLLIPTLMREIDLPPALTLMGQALMALVFGFLGLMVAVPAIAGMLVPIKMLYVEDVVGDEVSILGEDEDEDEDPGGESP